MRTIALAALVASAAAFSPMMSMETGRRQVVQAGAAAAVAAPLLRANPAEAQYDKSGRAPVILVMDHRGCNRGGPNAEYRGKRSGDSDDEMAVLEAAAGMRKSSKRSSFAARRTSDNYVHDWDSSKPSEGQSARLNKLRTQQSKLDGLNHKFAKQMQVSPGGPGMNGQ